jgi:hypothetical protein
MTLAEQWQTFATDVIAKDAGQIQITEMRRAFYAGAYSLLMIMMIMMKSEDADEDADAALVQGLLGECLAFAKAVEEGKA